ncbi:MAG TPA: ribosome rescue GTPase HflX [Nevskiaceae bacterium]|nr:ribosome rescue GTPase HflX [Nevskiaceae bacterium]
MSSGGLAKLIERPAGGQAAVLVHLKFPAVDYASEHDEFVELAQSSGAAVRAIIGGSRERPDAGLFAGTGKVDEIAAAVIAHQASLVVFNHELSPSQERNLERRLKVRVVDRTGLILDIFALRARSHEGQLQVELAQLRHLATRLAKGWTHLERQKGGIGLRGGPGETQIEIDRRLVRDKITTVERQLERVRARRAQGRRARDRNQVPSVSLVGYTNAGKSSLFNALTGADGYASNKLFATLDTTVRQLELAPGDSGTLADTVGFIRDLPHTLVAAFRATLEEVCEADLLLHVVDAADPERNARVRQVRDVLQEIGAGEVPALTVFNKIDLCPDEMPHVDYDSEGRPTRVFISARTGAGLDELRIALAQALRPDMVDDELCLPPSAAKLRAQLFALHAVNAEHVEPDGSLRLRVRLPYSRLVGLCRAAGVAAPAPPAPRRQAVAAA